MTVPVQTVASGTVNAAASCTANIIATLSGSMLVVLCPVRMNAAGNTWTISDSKGNTYQLAVQTGTGNQDQSLIYYCLNPIAGVISVTLTPNGTTMFGEITVVEWPGGVGGLFALDQIGQTYQTTGSPITVTATGADITNTDAVFACMEERGNGVGDNPSDPPAGYIHLSVQTSGAVNADESCYKINSSGGTNTVTWAYLGGATLTSGALASFTTIQSSASAPLMGQACL